MAENKNTVLLIEDNPGDARLIKAYVDLAAPGRFTVVHCERLEGAFGYLDQDPVDLILLDLSLPDSNGLASVRRLSAREERVPPIVVLTGLRDEALALQAVKEGAQDYLVKDDTDEKLLLRTMNYALERFRLQRSLMARTAELEGVNRALNVRSECNQVLVRAERVGELLNQICQIIVGTGGYRMAWIGFARRGAAKLVEPQAWAGTGSAYLQQVKVTWDESVWGSGPAGRAIRSGRPVFVPDLSTEPSFTPWLEAAQQYGYHAVMALPVLVKDELPGVLAVYGEERDVFDEKEVALFSELAEDIAHGLEALTNRRRRRQVEHKLGERERYFRVMIENAQDMITIVEEDGRIRYQSPAAEQVLGYRPEEMVGRSILDFIHPGQTEAVRRLLVDGARQPGSSVRQEVTLRHQNGSWRQLEATGKNLLDDPAVAGYIINSRDVTERRRAQTALNQSRERLLILHEIEQAILGARSPATTAETTLELSENLIPYQQAAIMLFEREGEHATILAARGTGERWQRGRRFKLDAGYLQTLATGRHIYHRDLDDRPVGTQLQKQLQDDGMSTFLSLPLLFRGDLLGEIFLAARAPGSFSHDHIQIAYEVAASLSVALQNALLFEETERRAQELEALVKVSAAMRSAEESRELLSTLAIQLGQLLDVRRIVVALREPGSATVTMMPVQSDGVRLREQRLPPAGGITAGVMGSGETFVTEDLGPESDLLRHEELSGHAAICLPMSITGDVIGALWAIRERRFAAYEQRLLSAIADMVTNALRRATLHEQTVAYAREIEQMIEAVPDGMLVLNDAGQISLANRAARAFLPALTETGVGEMATSLGGHSLDALLEPPSGNVPWHEVEVGEQPRIFEIVAQPIGSGAAAGATVLMIHDATEERQRQQFLQAQERLATVGQLAAGIAHDFNNIMAIITLYSQSLERNPDLPKRLQYLHTIGEQARHAANLITQILDFSRTSVMERHRVDLYPFVKEVVKLLERTVPERVSIDFEAQKGVYPVHGDPTRLQQMLMNLALNARDALPHGGRLSLALGAYSLAAGAQPPLPGMAPGEWIVLRVADTGTGIARDNLPHVFEPFFTTKEPGQGTGLGLAQVYGIVKQHGGEIGVESQRGSGTRFTIYLPALHSERTGEDDDEGRQQRGPAGRGEQILLVEDNQGTREAIADVLEMSNYRVLDAADGEEALRQFSANADEIDLVVSDMVMPHVDGLLLHQRLKEIRPEVKVVIITGYPLEEQGKSLLEEGIVAWIQKPFTADQVNAVIHAALNGVEVANGGV